VNRSPYAKRRFQQIGEAYAVLGDPAKRSAYDRGEAIPSGASSARPDPPDDGAGWENVGSPQPVLTPDRIDAGDLKRGERKTFRVRLRNDGGEVHEFTFLPAEDSWYRVTRMRPASAPRTAEIEIEVFHGRDSAPGEKRATVYFFLDRAYARLVLTARILDESSETAIDTRTPRVVTKVTIGRLYGFTLERPWWRRAGAALFTGIAPLAAALDFGPRLPPPVFVLFLLAAGALTGATVTTALRSRAWTNIRRLSAAEQNILGSLIWLGEKLFVGTLAVAAAIVVIGIVLGALIAVAVFAAILFLIRAVLSGFDS
jgi:curved DNA-binding protein CbpA